MNKHNIDLLVAQRLRKARTEAGMTLDALSKCIGVTTHQLSKYERCVNRITSGRLYDISIITNKPIGWFYEQEEN